MRKLNRFIFSRYFFSALMILLSMAMLFSIIFWAYNYSVYIYMFMMLLSALASLNIINKETNPDCMIAADSGMNFLHRNGIVPDIIAGDFDSVDDDSYRYTNIRYAYLFSFLFKTPDT